MLKETTKLTGIFLGSVLLVTFLAVAGKADKEEKSEVTLDWLTDFEDAKKQSAEKELPILINFTGSDWCGWCIRLDKEVFTKAEFKEFAAENLVMLKLDFPRSKQLPEEEVKRNTELARKYQVRGFPTILLVDAEGKMLGRTGYRPGGPGKYVEHLTELLEESQKAKQESQVESAHVGCH